MRNLSYIVLTVSLCFLVFGGIGCILEEKIIQIVYTGETCVDYDEDEDSANWNDTTFVDYADEIDQILEDNDIDKDKILGAHLVSCYYTVTDFPEHPDWDIGGAIMVARTDIAAGPAILIGYTGQSIEEAEGVEIPATLVQAGVDIINQALEDYLNGDPPSDRPELMFEIVNDSVVPEPTPADHMVFSWRACVKIHLIFEESYELPDVF